jgi:hypothetical protein
MAPLHQFLNMKVDWRHSHKGFGHPNRAGLEGAGDTETGASLHLMEQIEGGLS